MQTLRRIVCGIDFSEHAEQALSLALELALATGAQLTLAHVCELGADDLDDLDDQRLSRCRGALAEVVARPAHHRVQAASVLRFGTPWTKLDNVAAEVGASLIVVGRHGAGRGLRATLGSVADHLIRSASRPVLTVGSRFDRPGDEHDDLF